MMTIIATRIERSSISTNLMYLPAPGLESTSRSLFYAVEYLKAYERMLFHPSFAGTTNRRVQNPWSQKRRGRSSSVISPKQSSTAKFSME